MTSPFPTLDDGDLAEMFVGTMHAHMAGFVSVRIDPTHLLALLEEIQITRRDAAKEPK